jgi:hypothetical protein
MEIADSMAVHLLSYARWMSTWLSTIKSERQKELDYDDKVMCNANGTNSSNDSDEQL